MDGSCGLNDAPLAGKGTYEARIACNLNGKDGILNSDTARKKDKKNRYPYFTQSGKNREGDGDQYIANLKDGAWCGFKYFAFDGTESIITVTVRGQAEGKLNILKSQDLPPISSVPILPCKEWTEYSGSLDVPVGISPLYFIFEGDGGVDFSEFRIE